jgi:glyoxylase I family protein
MPEFPGVAHVAVTVTGPEAGGASYDELSVRSGARRHTDAGFRHLVWALPGGMSSVSARMSGVYQTSVSRSSASASTMSASAARAALTETWMDRLNALGIGHGGIVDIPGVK